MHSEREQIIESIRQRLRKNREYLQRQLGESWPDDGQLTLNEDTTVLNEFRRTETALGEIRSDTYGLCRLCLGRIAGERLEVFPFARICVPCQAKM